MRALTSVLAAAKPQEAVRAQLQHCHQLELFDDDRGLARARKVLVRCPFGVLQMHAMRGEMRRRLEASDVRLQVL